jgi:hypothetical protein
MVFDTTIASTRFIHVPVSFYFFFIRADRKSYDRIKYTVQAHPDLALLYVSPTTARDETMIFQPKAPAYADGRDRSVSNHCALCPFCYISYILVSFPFCEPT